MSSLEIFKQRTFILDSKLDSMTSRIFSNPKILLFVKIFLKRRGGEALARNSMCTWYGKYLKTI